MTGLSVRFCDIWDGSKRLAEDEQTVRGIIIAKDISDDLKTWACSVTQGITLKEYSITFLDKVN